MISTSGWRLWSFSSCWLVQLCSFQEGGTRNGDGSEIRKRSRSIAFIELRPGLSLTPRMGSARAEQLSHAWHCLAQDKRSSRFAGACRTESAFFWSPSRKERSTLRTELFEVGELEKGLQTQRARSGWCGLGQARLKRGSPREINHKCSTPQPQKLHCLHLHPQKHQGQRGMLKHSPPSSGRRRSKLKHMLQFRAPWSRRRGVL